MSDEPLTVAQTAALLGVSERTLRRALRLPELQAKLVAVSRHVGGRVRLVSLVDDHLLALLRQKYFSAEQQANQQASAGNLSPELVHSYERLIGEQAGRIADLQAALEHERQQSRWLTQALSDAQERLVTSDDPPRPSLKERLFGSSRKPRSRSEFS